MLIYAGYFSFGFSSTIELCFVKNRTSYQGLKVLYSFSFTISVFLVYICIMITVQVLSESEKKENNARGKNRKTHHAGFTTPQLFQIDTLSSIVHRYSWLLFES